MSKFRFLGICINDYPSSPLYGCVPDIMLSYKCVKNKFDFNEFNILDNKRATKKSIIEALKNSLLGLQKKDKVLIDYSGHGSFQPCNTATVASEATDYYDEGWVAYDYDYEGLLIDNELHNILGNINPAITLVVISDSCFSGSVLRHNPGFKWRNRFIPPPLGSILNSGELDLDDELQPKISRTATDKFRLKPFIIDTGDKQNNAILISACSDKQTAADAYFPNIGYHGALTYNLWKSLSENNWRLSYKDLSIKVNEKLKNNEYEQVSQLECKAELMDKYFLE